MNRILIDKTMCKNIGNNTFLATINNDGNYLINDFSHKYILNITNCKINVLSINDKDNNLFITFNINESTVSFNSICKALNKENIEVFLNSKNSKVNMYNSIISSGDCDCVISINHKASNTESNIYNCSFTKDDGSTNFKVISMVDKESNDCIVNQDSKIISLNKCNHNKINPILLIDNFTASAKHAAFLGEIPNDKLFYFLSRGIDEKRAYDLLLNGFLIGVMDISDEEKLYLINNLKIRG